MNVYGGSWCLMATHTPHLSLSPFPFVSLSFLSSSFVLSRPRSFFPSSLPLSFFPLSLLLPFFSPSSPLLLPFFSTHLEREWISARLFPPLRRLHIHDLYHQRQQRPAVIPPFPQSLLCDVPTVVYIWCKWGVMGCLEVFRGVHMVYIHV